METNNFKKYNFSFSGTNGKAVLLIHGITGTPSEMRYLGKGLNKGGFNVVCNTLPRHCSSLGELKKVTWQEIYAFCRDDLHRLKSQYAQVYIGGLSMGALMAVQLAREFPSEVSGIIALAPTLFYDGWALPKKRIFMYLTWHIPFIRNAIDIREGWPYGLKDEYSRAHIERFYKQARAGDFDQKVLLFGSPFFPLACLYQHHLFTKTVKKELSSVKSPILIIHAREDDMASPRNSQYQYEKIGSPKKSLVILEDSYHIITIDQEKEKVIAEVIKFLNTL
jgi:carboxylesterase